jgi:hypothetical protein
VKINELKFAALVTVGLCDCLLKREVSSKLAE